MTQNGIHTWDIVVDYQRCPKCGFINESRNKYSSSKEKLFKEVNCGRCHECFIVSKDKAKRFGPLFGNPTPADFTWD